MLPVYFTVTISRICSAPTTTAKASSARLLRATGQKGLSRRIIQREGAWELIPHPDSLPATLQAISQVSPQEFHLDRSHLRLHRTRFKFHTRSSKQAQRQLLQLEQRWLALPAGPS
jgi:hypothetical protein